jgi:hypothetical protein
MTTTRSKLYNLRQGKHEFAIYYTEFRSLVVKLSWDERVRHGALREGLSIELHRQLLEKEKGLNYKQFVVLCQELDVGLRALHHLEGKHNISHTQRTNQSRPHIQPPTVAPAMGGPKPMDVSTSGTGRGKISEQEKAARLREDRCLYCGLMGHMARHCPHKTRNPFRAASVQVEQSPDVPANPNPNTFTNPNPNTVANTFSGGGGGGNGGGGTGGQGQSGNT